MHPLIDERRYLIPFRGRLLPHIFCDTLVIGSGVAGLRAAMAAAESGEVILLSKSDLTRSNTAWAQGGIAAVLENAEESLKSHIKDTLQTGGGLSDPAVVDRVVRGAGAAIRELCDWGMRFDCNPRGAPELGLEGGHAQPRVLHADGDATGRELVRCLGEQVHQHAGIRIFENCFALDLLTPGTGENEHVLGAITHHRQYGLQIIWAKSTILATGGAGQVFRETSNSPVATGDGIAMAYRAGARVADMAFVQFHPTSLYIAGAERSLITEAVRGEGGHLVDRAGHRFMLDHHEAAELAPRDIVSRAIVEHLASTGETHVFLDVRHFKRGFFAERFPGIRAQLNRFGIDPERDLIPVHPSAHYTIGGVWTDDEGRTNLPGLLACGEGACSRLHGANRLASNSLLEGLVLGKITGQLAGAESNHENGGHSTRQLVSDIPPSDRGELDLTDVQSSMRSVMWRHLGIVRDGSTMRDVREMIDFWARYTLDKIFDEPFGWKTQNMLLVATLIQRSALWREESRGTHARVDFPETRAEFNRHDIWRRGDTDPEPATHNSGIGAAS